VSRAGEMADERCLQELQRSHLKDGSTDQSIFVNIFTLIENTWMVQYVGCQKANKGKQMYKSILV